MDRNQEPERLVQTGQTQLLSDAIYGKEDYKAGGSRREKKVNFCPQRNVSE